MSEIRKKEINTEEDKEVEFEDPQYEIKSFFIDPFDPGNEVLAKPGEGLNSVKVEATIKESEESSHVPGGFAFQVAADTLLSKLK